MFKNYRSSILSLKFTCLWLRYIEQVDKPPRIKLVADLKTEYSHSNSQMLKTWFYSVPIFSTQLLVRKTRRIFAEIDGSPIAFAAVPCIIHIFNQLYKRWKPNHAANTHVGHQAFEAKTEHMIEWIHPALMSIALVQIVSRVYFRSLHHCLTSVRGKRAP